MKVAFCGRSDLFKYKGGDAVQMEQTARELTKLGVTVDIHTNWDFDYSTYDIIHIFQLDWIAENYLYAYYAQKAEKKIVLSPIHHSIDEVKAYDDNFAFGYRRLSGFVLRNQFHRDTLKLCYRALFNPEKRIPALYAVTYGLKNLHKKTIKASNKVLVQTHLEAEDLKKTYNVPFSSVIVPNGVGDTFLVQNDNAKNLFSFKDYILCVGRIEARKNQLHIIDAVKQLREQTNKDINLVFVGQFSLSHKEYLMRFKQLLKQNPWISHIEKVNYENMPNVYKFAKVSVSASWFETTGLTVLEALICGANAVASGNRAKELLGNKVSYCDPSSVESILSAIKVQLNAPKPVLSPEFMAEFTWKKAALKTLKVYKDLLHV